MTLREWYAFNKPIWGKGDMIIAVSKDRSWNVNNQLLEALMSNEAAIEFFGNLELKRVSVAATESGYTTIRCFLWKP